MDKRKQNKGQPRKPAQDKKVPLVFSVKAKNRARLKARLQPIVARMDAEPVNTKEEDYV